jgi:hypothetical protein
MKPLDYLLFDATDEESGACSFDAMASVVAARLPALLGEVEAVLRWAHGEFGAPGEDGEWDYELQASDEADAPLAIGFIAGRVEMRGPQGATRRVTLTLTISGSRTFGEAFLAAFPPD